MKPRVALVALLLLVAACDTGPDGRRPLTADDSGSQVDFEVFEEFEVQLESNPSTGYGWVISEGSMPAAIDLMSEGFDPGDSGLVGAAGTQWFHFEAVESGAGVLRLEYLRPFDDPPIPLRIVEFVVRVGDAEWPPTSVTMPSTATATAPP